jgi:hypothetical protein
MLAVNGTVLFVKEAKPAENSSVAELFYDSMAVHSFVIPPITLSIKATL